MTPSPFDIGSSVRPADGFAVSGDAVVIRVRHDRAVLAILDVLGHGPSAHTVAVLAEGLLEDSESSDPVALLAMLDEELAGSLGAAAGVAGLHTSTGEGSYAGVGNTIARIFGSGDRRLVSVDGVIGQRHGALRPINFHMAAGEVLVLASDGLTSRFSTAEYPRLRFEDPVVAARELVRQFGKPHDDAACIVARRRA